MAVDVWSVKGLSGCHLLYEGKMRRVKDIGGMDEAKVKKKKEKEGWEVDECV